MDVNVVNEAVQMPSAEDAAQSTATDQVTEPEAKAVVEKTTPAAAELTPEAQLAADALAATESVSETPEDAEKKGLHGEVLSLREDRRASRKLIETLNETIRTMQQTAEKAKPPEPSPLEKFVAEFPDDPVPGRVSLEESRFQRKQAEIADQKRADSKAKAEGIRYSLRQKHSLPTSKRLLRERPTFLHKATSWTSSRPTETVKMLGK